MNLLPSFSLEKKKIFFLREKERKNRTNANGKEENERKKQQNKFRISNVGNRGEDEQEENKQTQTKEQPTKQPCSFHTKKTNSGVHKTRNKNKRNTSKEVNG